MTGWQELRKSMSSDAQEAQPQISTLNEKPLHADLKAWVARPGDEFEVEVDGFIIDIVRGDLLIEIQTAGFASIKRKLLELTARHPVRLSYPVAQKKWIVRLSEDGQREQSRRKSPKQGTVEDVFSELVSLPGLLGHSNFSLEVVLIHEEEIRRHEPGRAWRRRGWVTVERRLLEVVDRRLFETPADLAALIPPTLPEPFTTSDLATALSKPRRLAQRMAYCLREMEVISPVAKHRNAILYVRVAD
jgi:hypothetical protein